MGQFKFNMAGNRQNQLDDRKLTDDAIQSLIRMYRKKAGKKLKKPREDTVGNLAQSTEGN